MVLPLMVPNLHTVPANIAGQLRIVLGCSLVTNGNLGHNKQFGRRGRITIVANLGEHQTNWQLWYGT